MKPPQAGSLPHSSILSKGSRDTKCDMVAPMRTRREWVQSAAGLVGAAAGVQDRPAASEIVLDPKPLYSISPLLYMQFMEPLGVTDSSVEAAWDYTKDAWREDFVDVLKDLAPGSLRFGGNLSRFYKWREGVGDAGRRPSMRNYDWGGKETNRVGTAEFVSLARSVGAEPFYCVNFLGDGIAAFRKTPEGDRTGNAEEAADWVSYANDKENRERLAHGVREPYGLKLWQIGNETSYVKEAFPKQEAVKRTAEFARAMKKRDQSIQLIGWGDKGRGSPDLWARDMLRGTGGSLDMIAIHMMGQSPVRRDTVLAGMRYQAAPELAWEELLELSNKVEARIGELESAIDDAGSHAGIAVTEGHLSLRPHNINPLLYEWVSAVYHARSLNIYQRHGARVKIATAADFNGTRWTVMALQTPVPRGRSFLMPVGTIMRLFKRHNGSEGVRVASSPATLDIAASRTAEKLFLHVVNLDCRKAVPVRLRVKGAEISGGRVLEIAPPSLRSGVSQDEPDVFRPVEKMLPREGAGGWTFPAASVSVVELDIRPSSA